VLVSEALEAAGITAVLGGGGAVSQYSANEGIDDKIIDEIRDELVLVDNYRRDVRWSKLDVYGVPFLALQQDACGMKI